MYYNMINENRKICRIVYIDNLVRSNYKKFLHTFYEAYSVFSHRKFFVFLLHIPDRMCGFIN